MIKLVNAYEQQDVKSFETTLKESSIVEDPFLMEHTSDLLKTIRADALLKMLIPYKRISIPFLSKEINIPPKEVEELLVALIRDNKLRGRVDQVNQLLELDSK